MQRRSRAVLLLLLALLSGSTAAVLALQYLRRQATPLMAIEAPKSKVVVAARSLGIGAVIDPRDVKAIDWSGSAVPAGYVASAEEVVGRGVMVPLEENEPILTHKLAIKGVGGGLSAIIDDGMRAVSVAVDQVVGVSGFVLPNTRVDVLLTLGSNSPGQETGTKVIMQNVRTLAAGQSIQQDRDGKPQEVGVVTFLVTPEQAETLTLAASQGRIQLALRNMLDTNTVRTEGTRVGNLLTASPGGRRVRRPVPARSDPPESNSITVEVFRGGQRTLQRFEY